MGDYTLYFVALSNVIRYMLPLILQRNEIELEYKIDEQEKIQT
uniref:Uncharacterized protein n=1 Tax=Arundo donax TaxID=35708 RepID=A0A0A9BUU4_ARUDO